MGSKFSLTPSFCLVSRGVDYIDWPHTKSHIDCCSSSNLFMPKVHKMVVVQWDLIMNQFQKTFYDVEKLASFPITLAAGGFGKKKIKCLCIYWPLHQRM